MPWWYLFETLTGRLRSETSVDPSGTLPVGISVSELVERAPDSHMWDEMTRTFVPRPPQTFGNRIDDMFADVEFASGLSRLNATQRQALRNVIQRHSLRGTIVYPTNDPDKGG